MCILETALTFKILLNIFYLRHAPNVNVGHESDRLMIDMIGFSDINDFLLLVLPVTLLEKEGSPAECRQLTMSVLIVYARTIL